MAQIIVDPSEQRAFAAALEELVHEMRHRQGKLADSFHHLQLSWQDDRAERFAREQLEMEIYLNAFYNMSRRYVDYLRDKARLADDYLDCGR